MSTIQAISETAEAVVLANRVLDRINADPDDDMAVLARQFLRQLDVAQNYRALRSCARLRIMGYAGNISPGDKSQAPAGHVHLGLELWSHHPEPTEQRSLDIFDRFVAILREHGSSQAAPQ